MQSGHLGGSGFRNPSSGLSRKFTLIEMMVLVGVLAILAVLMFVRPATRSQDVVRESAFPSKAQAVSRAMAMIRLTNPLAAQQYASMPDNDARFAFVVTTGNLSELIPSPSEEFTGGWVLTMPVSFDGAPVLTRSGVTIRYE